MKRHYLLLLTILTVQPAVAQYMIGLTLTSTEASCNGNEGTISATATKGVPPYEYSIDGGTTWQTSPTFTGLRAGTYTVTVEDAVGTRRSEQVQVTSSAGLSLTADPIKVKCNGESTGSITLTANGGTPPYRYSIDGGTTWKAKTIFSDLPAGKYPAMVKDSNDCRAYTLAIITEPQKIAITSYALTNVACKGEATGSIILTTTNGTSNYSIDNGITWQPLRIFTELPAMPIIAIARDDMGCLSDAIVTSITEPATAISLTATSTGASCSGNEGTISITATGGVPPYRYSVDNGTTWQTGATFTGLTAGTHTIMVEDAGSCQTSTLVDVPSLAGLSLTATSTDVACRNEWSGSIALTASGGTTPYQYSINGGTTWQAGTTFAGLPAGTHTVMVKDADSCQLSIPATITQPYMMLTIHTVTSHFSPCDATTNGTATITPNGGGTPPYSYSMDGGSTWQTSPIFTGLDEGMYDFMIKDSNGCTAPFNPRSYSVSGSKEKPSYTVTVTPGCNSAIIAITPTNIYGSSYRYSYTATPMWTFRETYTATTPGVYTVRVMSNDRKCISTSYVNVHIPPPLSLTTATTGASCANNDGSITFTATGGTPPYQYSIDGGTTAQTGPTFTGLMAGSYFLSLEDSIGCQVTTTVNVPSLVGLGVTATPTNVVCPGTSTGSIAVVASGGATPYKYSIDGGSTWQTGTTFTGLPAGIYTSIVKDAGGCKAIATVAITEPADISITEQVRTHPKCNGDSNGVLGFEIAGGTPPHHYSIDGKATWIPGGTNVTGLPAGWYDVYVKDANGCEISFNTSLKEPLGLTLTTSINNVSCIGNDGSILATAIGGTSPYLYSIDGGTTWQTDAFFTGLTAGIYSVIVKDKNGCMAYDASVNVSTIPSISVTVTATAVSCNDNNGTITAIGSGGTPSYQYSIDGGTTWQYSATFTNLSVGTYTISIKDSNSCPASTTVNVVSAAGLSLTLTPSNTFCEQGTDGSITATASGGVAPYMYSIDGGTTWQSGATFSGLAVGWYTVIVKDAGNCQISSDVYVDSSTKIALTLIETSTTCYGDTDGTLIITAAGGSGGYKYSIDNGVTFSSSNIFTGLAAGTYPISVIDSNGCLSRPVGKIIQEPNLIGITASLADNTCKATITANATGGSGSYQYSIDGGTSWQASPTFTNLADSIYTITVNDSNGCSGSETVSLNMDYLNINPDKIPDYKNGRPYNAPLQTSAIAPYTFVADSGFPSWLTVQPNGMLTGTPVTSETTPYTFTVKLIDANGCEVFKTYTITGTTFIPDLITPNGDGQNDYFMKGYRVIIYDRLGTKIFEGNDGWDGTRKGKTVIDDTYFYVLFVDNDKVTGSITVITQ